MVKKLIDVAAGRIPADIVLKNATYADVFSCELRGGDIALCGGKIAGVGKYSGKIEIDCSRLVALPAFTDAHVHIESSMLSVEEFARLVIPRGTGTVIADPHEICNVCGENGLEYMKRAAAQTPLDVRLMLPSCVPATAFETSGASFGKDFIRAHMSRDFLHGLGEFMDYPAAVAGDGDALSKLAAASEAGKVADGHAPGLSGQALNAYISAGVATDHECLTPEEAAEKVSKGMYVLLRHGSSARNLDVAAAVNDKNYKRFLICTDDRHAADLASKGHIDDALRQLIRLGVPPVQAVSMATLNAAECYNLRGKGAIAPGYSADITLVDNLEDFNSRLVILRGNVVAREGKASYDGGRYLPDCVLDTVRMRPLTAQSFRIEASGKARAIYFVPDTISTRCEIVDLGNWGGNIRKLKDVLKLAVCERHGKNGNIGLGLLKGYGFSGGALALTVAHDSHNLIILGDDDEKMAEAGNALVACGGGMAIACDKGVKTVKLGIAGLMSEEPAERFTAESEKLYALARKMGVRDCYDPFMTLAFAALPVIPEIRLTDRGLFDVNAFCHTTVEIK